MAKLAPIVLHQPLVSVALCSYNGAKYIEEQIQSILVQTHSHLELVICDDGSTDNTWEIISNLAKQNSTINIYRNEVNLGFNKNFEKAFSLCRGEYIAISDQDDIWMPQKIEILLNNIGEADVIFSNSTFINDQGEKLNKKLLNEFNFNEYNSYKSILLDNFVTGHTCLIKRSFLFQILPFPEGGYYDWWLGFVALYHKKLAFCDHCLTQYRTHHTAATYSLHSKSEDTRKHRFSRSNKLIIENLNNFIQYKNLSEIDKYFIKTLINAFEKKNNSWLSIELFGLIKSNFNSFFPSEKRRYIRKLNFIFKYSRGAKFF